MLQFPHHRPGNGADVHALTHEVAARHVGQFEQVVDQLPHPLCSESHAIDVHLSFFVQQIAAILLQRLAEAVDVPQGSPQIVGDRVAEGFKLLVDDLKLVGPVLQVVVKKPDFFFGPPALRYVPNQYDDFHLPEGEQPHLERSLAVGILPDELERGQTIR